MSAAASTSRELPYYVQGFGGSSALLDLSATTVKNLPYAFFATELHMDNLTNFITSRVSYGECALRSVASTIYNFAVGTVFTVLALATLGQNKAIYNATLKYWMYTGFAVASLGIAILGVVSTQAAAVANGGLLGATGGYAAVSADEEVGVMIRQLFKENKKKIMSMLPGDIDTGNLESRISRITRLTDLVEIVRDALNGNIYTAEE